ncbi:Autophagy protein 16, partial [Bienertia sinuspersici]
MTTILLLNHTVLTGSPVNLAFIKMFLANGSLLRRRSLDKGRRSKSQKRKANNTPPHDKDAKATRDSYRKGPLKMRLTRGASTCSPKEPAMESTKGDRSRSPSQSFKDGKPSKDKDRTVLQDIFDGTDSCGETLSDEEQKGLQGDASIVDELRAIHNVCFMVNSIRDRLLAMPLCDIHGLDNEFKELFDYINAMNIDVLGLQEHELKAQLSSLESLLSNVAYSQKKDEEQIQLQRARMDEIQQRRDELRKELLQLDEEESKLSSLLASSEDSLQKHVTVVKDLTDSHTSLERDITIAEEVAAKLEEANKGLKDDHDSLKSFKWEP